MVQNKLFTAVTDEKAPEDKGLIVRPTDYMAQLEPEEATGQLKTHVQTLSENAEQHVQNGAALGISLEETKGLIFELELSRSYLARVLERWSAA